MTPIEKLKSLEAKASKSPWKADDETADKDEPCWCIYGNGAGSEECGVAILSPAMNPRLKVDASLIATLRSLAPELIALWESVDAVHKAAATLDMTDTIGAALCDVMGEALDALNAKAEETLSEYPWKE